MNGIGIRGRAFSMLLFKKLTKAALKICFFFVEPIALLHITLNLMAVTFFREKYIKK